MPSLGPFTWCGAFLIVTVNGWQTNVSEDFWNEVFEREQGLYKNAFQAGVQAAEYKHVQWWKGLSSRHQGLYSCGYEAGLEEHAKAKAASQNEQEAAEDGEDGTLTSFQPEDRECQQG